MAWAALNFIEIRASLLDAEQLISGDRYAFMRDAYLQRREYLIKDGQVTDEFLDEDWTSSPQFQDEPVL
jgi:phospholipid-binding lipoprotein MlaA